MIARWRRRALREIQPRDGWLPIMMLAATVGTLIAAVLAAKWSSTADIVLPVASLALFLAALLAERPLGAAPAWALLTAYGVVAVTLLAGRFLPPLSELVGGWPAVARFWRVQAAIFADRLGGWLAAAASGGASDDPLVFTLVLGLLAWFLPAAIAWSALRRRRPLTALTLTGITLAANNYFGSADPLYATAFVALAALLAGVSHFANLESQWTHDGVDYSPEIRLEVSGYALAIAAGAFLLAAAVPALPVTAVARAFINSAPARAAETTLERLFGGAGGGGPVGRGGDDGPGGRGVLPRAYLLGDAPELYETVMFTATVQNEPGRLVHWRAASYDVYTGRGWARTAEQDAPLPAGRLVELTAPTGRTITLTQNVHWQFDARRIRYTLGLPRRFADDATIFWRGSDDFVRALGEPGSYRAVTAVPVATPDELRRIDFTSLDPALRARYTVLPDLPERVSELARSVAGDAPTPYDQVQALERFLRQYPYSLAVSGPPPGSDAVDYFLFELQAGYCDYYASAMVVLARSLGLPARLAIGYLPQAAVDGVQTVYQINGHSWAEIYFPGHGWIEFEPTASFPTTEEGEATVDFGEDPALDTVPPPLPESEAQLPAGPLPWWPFLLLASAALALWRRRKTAPEAGVLWAYGRLRYAGRRLGIPTAHSQTPAEFGAAFIERLEKRSRRQPALLALRDEVGRLVTLFVERQYGRRTHGDAAARTLWGRLQRPLLRWRLAHLWARFRRRGPAVD